MKYPKPIIMLAALIITFAIGFYAGLITPSSEAGDVVQASSRLYTFFDLLDAIEQVESRGNPNAIGPDGEVGSFQIKLIYLCDVNWIIGDGRYEHLDRLSPVLSREMVKIYLKYWYRRHCDPPTLHIESGSIGVWEPYARIHNGGPNGYKKESTKSYWLKVKAELEK